MGRVSLPKRVALPPCGVFIGRPCAVPTVLRAWRTRASLPIAAMRVVYQMTNKAHLRAYRRDERNAVRMSIWMRELARALRTPWIFFA